MQYDLREDMIHLMGILKKHPESWSAPLPVRVPQGDARVVSTLNETSLLLVRRLGVTGDIAVHIHLHALLHNDHPLLHGADEFLGLKEGPVLPDEVESRYTTPVSQK
jgi:hypothetical protein